MSPEPLGWVADETHVSIGGRADIAGFVAGPEEDEQATCFGLVARLGETPYLQTKIES